MTKARCDGPLVIPYELIVASASRPHLLDPVLVSPASAREFSSAQFPGLPGLLPGVGRFDDCSWGLGTELRGTKQPHWTGRRNSTATFGHFGGAGTLVWVDPIATTACIALTDRPFDEWAGEALVKVDAAGLKIGRAHV